MNIQFPKIIFGSSALGNLYEVVPESTKHDIVANWLEHQSNTIIDSAGKYGAGLALENIGRYLKKLSVDRSDVLISNKLGWKRTPLTTPEPTFEQGAWFGLEHDAEQCISYDGILECYEQGNALLGDYDAELLSVHDPDEYLAAADSEYNAAQRYEDILGAYKALTELRKAGKAKGIGVGSKDWKIIKRLFDDGVSLDWVMLANSFTLLTHPKEVMDFMEELHAADITIINSAVFNAGFLIGGKYFDYQIIDETSHPELFQWRNDFNAHCAEHGVTPALACCQFALSPPGVAALALNTSQAERVAQNVAFVETPVPAEFWKALKEAKLLDQNYPYL
ncbi:MULTISPECIES: aldo/keto reductase [unclassified Lentimonas]|uniref:aldo/keto reductase n=1 Tax=unclassified Lentimonas TaxID=2630993 RepID=UPI001329709E|nr:MULTISPECIES: aldo/keto reductase [unclassified Lentimonas]CAA6692726.1 L-fuco-beta-pyranose dehydrogenase (EC [Lentimonas sp. CC10]CAA6696708.1 L-fuco-beta-pyranose dehydrogenase (EC [Lentimonas sp. CC19]CAA7072312.1 L-fuco-beta-pyranose dehydrogenase (EC [Lentimonas sp. CC11]